MTPKQKQMVSFLLKRYGVTDVEGKEAIVIEYTRGRTTDMEEMTHRETVELVNALNAGLNPSKLKRDKQVGKILSMAHEMRWELPNGKVDMDKLNAFLLTRTPQKKILGSFTDAELPGLVTLFEKVHLSFLESL